MDQLWLLDNIGSPAGLRKLNEHQLVELCSEIRKKLIEIVDKNGGHLASNLGSVELTVALDYVFDFPKDTLIFDVGHQCYTHKLLTGRLKQIDTLRQENGISGFPKPSESSYDSFIEGHASTSISQAVGLANAKKIKGDGSKTIAFIGDGAFTGGLAFEAINNSKNLGNLIIVLNDNSMSISKSVGNLADYFLDLRTSSEYLGLKKNVKQIMEKVPLVGKPAANFIDAAKDTLRRSIYGGTLFEELGCKYIGPVDGHDVNSLIRFFTKVRDMHEGRPILVHAITQKGKGYAPAENNPGAYHGVGPMIVEKGNPDISKADSFSNSFGKELDLLADSDSSICAVTAAMKYGTGLGFFSKSHPERFFDVGIAEGHAVTMSAGLAKGGMKPVFCVYSTFLQRAVDMLIHDVAIDDLPVMLGIDRAGFVGNDGETHQGIYDAAILNAIGHFKVVSPCNYDEQKQWLGKLLSESRGPSAVRYPRGKEDASLQDYRCTLKNYDLIGNGNADILFVTYGIEFAEVLAAVSKLKEEGITADILKMNVILPVDGNICGEITGKYERVIFAEEGVKAGGIGETIAEDLMEAGFKGTYKLVAVGENNVVKQASVSRQKEIYGLDSGSLYRTAKDILHEAET